MDNITNIIYFALCVFAFINCNYSTIEDIVNVDDNGDRQVHIFFPKGNEFTLTENGNITIPIKISGLENPRAFQMMICSPSAKDNCFSAEIRGEIAEINIREIQSFGKWPVILMRKNQIIQEKIKISMVYIHNSNISKYNNGSIIWCPRTDSSKYITFTDRPVCPRRLLHDAPVENGLLTIFKPNIEVYKFKAYSCSLISQTVHVNCRLLGYEVTKSKPILKPVEATTCNSWVKQKKCDHGILSNIKDSGRYQTNNVLEIKYNFWDICLRQTPWVDTKHNCIYDEKTVRFAHPYTHIDTPLGQYNLSSVTNGFVMGMFQTTVWNPFSPYYVCKHIPYETMDVTKTTYTNVDQYHISPTVSKLIKEVYHFKSDIHKVILAANNLQLIDVANISDSKCIKSIHETYSIEGGIILQYVSKMDINSKEFGSYHSNVRHVPRYQTVSNGMKVSDDTHILTRKHQSIKICDVHLKDSCDYKNTSTSRTHRNRRETSLHWAHLNYLKDSINTRMDKFEKDMVMAWCENQQRFYDVQIAQTPLEPSKVFSSFLNYNVKVKVHGDIYALLPCKNIDVSEITMVRSLRVDYSPMKEIYRKKGIHLNNVNCFTRPIVKFTHNGQDIYGQLISQVEVLGSLPFKGKCKGDTFHKRQFSDRVDRQFFRLGNHYYVFVNYTMDTIIHKDDIGSQGINNNLDIKTVDMFTPQEISEPDYILDDYIPDELYTYEERYSVINSLYDVFVTLNRNKEMIDYYGITTSESLILNTTSSFASIVDGIGHVGAMAGDAIGGFVGGIIGGLGTSVINTLTSFMNTLVFRIVTIVGIIGGISFLVYFGVIAALGIKRGQFNNAMTLTHPPESNYLQPTWRRKRNKEITSSYKQVSHNSSDDEQETSSDGP